MVPGANSEAEPSSMETEYLKVEPSRRMSSAVRLGTKKSAIRCRQVNRGVTSSAAAAVGGMVLTRLFQHTAANIFGAMLKAQNQGPSFGSPRSGENERGPPSLRMTPWFLN